MKRPLLLLTLLLVAALPLAAEADDDLYKYPIQEAMAAGAARLDHGVRFYFGNEDHPNVVKELGTFTATARTNRFGKDEKEACDWAFLSAMLKLQRRAEKLGGNAVVAIESAFKNRTFVSETQYECGYGFLMAGVRFKATVVVLEGEEK